MPWQGCLGGGSWSLRATPSLGGDDRWSDIKSIAVELFQIIKYQYLHFNYPLLVPPGQCQEVWRFVCECKGMITPLLSSRFHKEQLKR